MERLLSKDNRAYLMGLSILWIVVFHYCFYGNLLPIRFFNLLFSRGYVGVDIFLFLSAYGLCFSIEGNGIKRFYLNRLKRLFPMYILFVAVAVYFFHQHYSDPAVKLAIFQCTGLASFRMVDFEWFIPALIVLYAVFPLFYKGVQWLYEHGKWVITLLLLAVALVVPVISKVVFPIFAYRFPIFILGIVAFLALQNDDRKYLLAVFVFCAAFAIIAKLSEGLMLSLLVPIVLWGLGEIDIKFPLEKPISFIGKHSLEIYLAQNLALNHYYLNSDSPFVIKCFVALAIIVAGSFVLYYFQKGFYLLFIRHEQN